MINQMAKELILLKIMTFMKEIGSMEWNREMDKKYGKIMISTMDNGIKIYNMELESFKKQMEIYIKENLQMEKFKEEASYRKQMEINMKVNGLMINLMVKAIW